MRNIVKDAIDAEIPKLLNEIKDLHFKPHACSNSSKTEVELRTTETHLLQSVSVACQTETNDEDSFAFRNLQEDGQAKPQNGKPFPASRLKLKQDSPETDDTSKTELRESTATSKHKFGPRAGELKVDAYSTAAYSCGCFISAYFYGFINFAENKQVSPSQLSETSLNLQDIDQNGNVISAYFRQLLYCAFRRVDTYPQHRSLKNCARPFATAFSHGLNLTCFSQLCLSQYFEF